MLLRANVQLEGDRILPHYFTAQDEPWLRVLIDEYARFVGHKCSQLHERLAQPLAARNPEDPQRILAWDLIVDGSEIATGFTELVDPVLQREILTEQSLAAAQGDQEAMELDEDFLRALEMAAPPMGGAGLGLDRLVMLFTGGNIREVIPFPLMKKEIF
jgi:lysyl-tRNA synthetase class II